MENYIMNMKVYAMTVRRQAKAIRKREVKDIKQLRDAMNNQDHGLVQIYAQSVVRYKHDRVYHVEMAVRIESAASKLQQALLTKQVKVFVFVG